MICMQNTVVILTICHVYYEQSNNNYYKCLRNVIRIEFLIEQSLLER